MSDKLDILDLEPGMAFWVKEWDGWYEIVSVNYTLSNKAAVTFNNKKTLFFDNRRRFELM